MLSVAGHASYAYPNGVQHNAHLLWQALSHAQSVPAAEVPAVVERHGEPSWDWAEWKTRAGRSITLHEWARLAPGSAVLLVLLAVGIRRWRSWLLSASVAVLVVVFGLAPLMLRCLPPYRSFDYINEFVLVPNACYPGDTKAILLYEKPDLRPLWPNKAVVFCNGSPGWLPVAELQAALKEQGVALGEHDIPSGAAQSRLGE